MIKVICVVIFFLFLVIVIAGIARSYVEEEDNPQRYRPRWFPKYLWLIISLFLILVFDGSGRQNIFFVIFMAAITYFITRSYLGEEFNYFEVYDTYIIVKYLGSAKNIIYYQNVDGWKYLGYSTNSHTEHFEFRDLNCDFLCNFYMYPDDKYVSKLLSPIIYRMERGEFPSSDVQKEIYSSLRAEHPEYAVYETNAELAIEYLKRHPAVSGLTGEGAYVLHDRDEDEN